MQQYGEQSFNIGRNAWLQAGLPYETPATTIDRQCGSAQQAVNFGATLIASGVHDVTIGSGVESMGRIPMFVGRQFEDVVGSPFTPELLDHYNLIDQGFSAEMIAEQWNLPREQLDEIGARSQQRAERAATEGRFDREIVPVAVNGGLVSTDQGIRPGTTAEGLAELKPAFKEDGVITAGNSSQISDGAAAVLLMSRETADELGLKARARIVDQTTVGVDPVIMLTGPIPATRKILERNKLTHRRHRPLRGERGLLVGRRRLGEGARRRSRAGQRERRRDRARPSARLDRRAADHDAAARARALRQGARARDDVLRRWARHGDADPAGVAVGARLDHHVGLRTADIDACHRVLGRRRSRERCHPARAPHGRLLRRALRRRRAR